MSNYQDSDFDDVDWEAMERAIEIARRDPDRAAQLDAMLATRARWDVGWFAAYSVQYDKLGLKPWETPPCSADANGDGPTSRLRARMLQAGVSQFEPDPMRALAEAEAEAKGQTKKRRKS